jgi:hypothetical protein
VIEVDLPALDPVLVVNSRVVPDSTFSATITASQASTASGDPQLILNATVVVEHLGQVVDTLHHFFEGKYLGTGSYLPVPGQTYTLKASASGYAPVVGTETLPLPVPIRNLSWQDSVRTALDGTQIGEIAIEFDDSPGEENFYMILVVASDSIIFGPDTSVYHAALTAEVQDPAAINDFFGNSILLDDATFDGQRKSLKLGVEIGQNASRMSVVLFSCSKNYFLYNRTVTSAIQNNDNPFAEPVFVHSNMSSKMGIFAGYSQHWRHL